MTSFGSFSPSSFFIMTFTFKNNIDKTFSQQLLTPKTFLFWVMGPLRAATFQTTCYTSIERLLNDSPASKTSKNIWFS